MSNDTDLYSLVGEPIAVLRKRYLTICDGNHCAAMLLDLFAAKAATAEELEFMGSENVDPHIYTTISRLTQGLYELFDQETVHHAFFLLISKGYIKAWNIGEIESNQEQRLKIVCGLHNVEEACKPYYAEIQAKQEQLAAQARARREIEQANQPPPPSQEELARRAHARKIAEERKRVEQHCKRARKAGLTATLTLDQWLETLEYFHWQCAYCQIKKFELLEHFVPVIHGEGTTQTNCVPACRSCNGLKQSWNPLKPWGPDMSHIKDGIERIKGYFAQLRKGDDDGK